MKAREYTLLKAALPIGSPQLDDFEDAEFIPLPYIHAGEPLNCTKCIFDDNFGCCQANCTQETRLDGQNGYFVWKDGEQ